MLCQFQILQDGRLPLKPNGQRTDEEHVCMCTLIWPAGVPPSRSNSVLVDPCFSAAGWRVAQRRLQDLGGDFDCIGYYFETHQHYDHVLGFSLAQIDGTELPDASRQAARWSSLEDHGASSLPGLTLVKCPGHASELQAVRCKTADGDTWVVGDAILDRDWLLAWMFFWPNHYEALDVVETWRSVAKILDKADVVIPGHGPPIRVDAELLQTLLDRFPKAFQAHWCPEVARVLRSRLERLGQTQGS